MMPDWEYLLKMWNGIALSVFAAIVCYGIYWSAIILKRLARIIWNRIHRPAQEIRKGAHSGNREVELMRWKLDALAEWATAMIEESNSPQYGRDVRTLLEVGSMDEAREIDAL